MKNQYYLIMSTLSSSENPKIPIDVGTHEIKVELPTVQEDFFDVGSFEELLSSVRYRSAVTHTFKKKIINRVK
jgi:hypothetical protein